MTTTVRWADSERGAAVVGLGEAILDELGAGAVVPCVLLPGDWTSDEDDEDARYLARVCAGCPVLPACRAYVDEHPEPAGVWAGTTAKQRRRMEQRMNDETTNDGRGIGEDERELVRVAVGVTGALMAGDRAGAEHLLRSLAVKDAAFVIACQAELVSRALEAPAGTPPELFTQTMGHALAGGTP